MLHFSKSQELDFEVPKLLYLPYMSHLKTKLDYRNFGSAMPAQGMTWLVFKNVYLSHCSQKHAPKIGKNCLDNMQVLRRCFLLKVQSTIVARYRAAHCHVRQRNLWRINTWQWLQSLLNSWIMVFRWNLWKLYTIPFCVNSYQKWLWVEKTMFWMDWIISHSENLQKPL